MSEAFARLGPQAPPCLSRLVKALVTGGAGFIGSHVVESLIAAGATVHVVDTATRLDNLSAALSGGAEIHAVDVTDAAAMIAVTTAVRPRVVLHLAAQIDARRSIDDPSHDAAVNVAGTAAVLEAARRGGARRVLLASTAGVYGLPPVLPTPESAPLEPLTPYGNGKAAAESYLRLYERLYGLPTLALRMANVYGPRQDPHGEAGIVAICAGAAATDTPVTIFGDGLQTRDFVHVGDVAAAFVAATEAGVTGAVNIGTGRETSVAAVADALGVETLYGPHRTGEVARSCLDPAAAADALGWRPRIALADGLSGLRAAPDRIAA
jgi:UDP-glucose 4-epimerase